MIFYAFSRNFKNVHDISKKSWISMTFHWNSSNFMKFRKIHCFFMKGAFCTTYRYLGLLSPNSSKLNWCQLAAASMFATCNSCSGSISPQDSWSQGTVCCEFEPTKNLPKRSLNKLLKIILKITTKITTKLSKKKRLKAS